MTVWPLWRPPTQHSPAGGAAARGADPADSNPQPRYRWGGLRCLQSGRGRLTRPDAPARSPSAPGTLGASAVPRVGNRPPAGKVYRPACGGTSERGLKYLHEVRDPVHQFISMTTHERKVVDSRPAQRLRSVSQLALTSHVYPGATHRRFEHSLGVMHLAGEAFDVLTRRENVPDAVMEVVPELNEADNLRYWRTVVRMAAMCHDLGHLPFSHAAEHDILPPGTTHETLSERLVVSEGMREVFASMVPTMPAETIAKIAVGPGKAGVRFTTWEAILSDIVTGNAFGVDRIDYLLRDSHHTGVAYGRFDHLRLIQSLRLLQPVKNPGGDEDQGSLAPSVGVERGGLSAAEGLLLARYFMFGQVYFHPVRVVYDLHLIDFLRSWLPGGQYSSDLEDHLQTTDDAVWQGMRESARDPLHPAHDPASRILERRHYKQLLEQTPDDQRLTNEPGKAVHAWALDRYGPGSALHRLPTKSGGPVDFPVLEKGLTVASSTSLSETLRSLPANRADLVFIKPEYRDDAVRELRKNRAAILAEAAEREAAEEDDEAAGQPPSGAPADTIDTEGEGAGA